MRPQEFLAQNNKVEVDKFVKDIYEKMKLDDKPVIPYKINGRTSFLDKYFSQTYNAFALDGWTLVREGHSEESRS